MQVPEFIAQQPAERQGILTRLHSIILQKDPSVTPTVGMMMGKEMILYNAPGIFKYGLASVKNYMSLHILPIYGSPTLYSKYQQLLPKASFQKGCINFRDEEEMPVDVVEQLISDCSTVDLLAIYQQSRSKKSK
jgi:hypothetical protein